MISEEACLAINILQLEPVEGEESSKSRRIQGRVCLPLNLRSSLSRGRIKLTLQQATTYASAILFLDRSGGREKWREAADDASPPIAHILHLITFLKYDPASAKRFHTILVFPHPPGRGVSRFFAGEERFEGLRAKHHSICKISRVAEAK